MARKLKQSTAKTVVVGPFVDSSGAAVTAPTIASIDITAYKDGGTAVTITPAASGSSNDMVHVDDGFYSLELTATDTNTCGYLRLTFQISGSLIFMEDFEIVDGASYNQEVLGYEYTSEGKRIWFVDGSTDGTGDTGTRAAPFDTVVAAVAAAGPGDTIRIAAGTYNGRCEWTTPGLTLIGDDAETTFIVHGTSYTVKPGPHTTIRQLYIYSTDAALGTSIDGGNSKYLTVEDCNLYGPYDGMWADVSFCFVMRRTNCASTYDGLRLQSAAQALLEDCIITSDGTHVDAIGPYRGVFGGTFGGVTPTDTHQVRCINCTFSAVTAQDISTQVAAFESTGNVIFENCEFIARNTNASSDGDVFGIHEGFGDSGCFTIIGGTSAISNAGSGAKRHINLFGSTTIANAIGLQRYMFSGTAAADSARVYDLAPTATVVAAATRTNLATELARVDAAISSRNATTPLDAAGTRAALGLSAANLDTQIAAVKADSAAILVDTAAIEPLVTANLDAQVSDAISAGSVTADRVAKQQTFFIGSEGNVARNIVTLNAWSSGTRTLAFDFSELLDQADTRINAVSTVTVVQSDGSPSITTSNLRKHQNGKVAIWDTAAISSANAGTYVVTVTITTLDSNTIVVTGTLEVD